MLPIVLVTPNFEGDKISINEKYIKKLESWCVPLLMCYDSMCNIDAYLEMSNGIVLTGGGDIAEDLCNGVGENSHNDVVIRKRDVFELELVRKAYTMGIPMLGICRGLQVINVAIGGNLNMHVDNHVQNIDRNLYWHNVTLDKNSELYRLTGMEEIKVNSVHHQCIHTVADCLNIAGVSEDGIIEYVENIENNIIGIQWHAECINDTINDVIFEIFKKKCYN